MERALGEALVALENDHEFLLEGNVLTKDLVDTWIAYKREHEHELLPMALHPHP